MFQNKNAVDMPKKIITSDIKNKKVFAIRLYYKYVRILPGLFG